MCVCEFACNRVVSPISQQDDVYGNAQCVEWQCYSVMEVTEPISKLTSYRF